MLRKILYLAVGLGLLSLVFVGFNASAQKNKEVNDLIKELNETTDSAVINLGSSPTLENIQRTQRELEEKKIVIRKKLSSVNLSDLAKTNSDKANEVRQCFENNVNKFIAVYQNTLKNWYEDLDRINKLREREKNLSSNASFAERLNLEKELIAKRKDVETNIELLNALVEMTEIYKSIFTE